MLTPPAVMFVRCFDVAESRMVNLWYRLETQEQIDAYPRATELTVKGKTVEDVLKHIAEIPHWVTSGEMDKIKEAVAQIKPTRDPIYQGFAQ